MPPLVLTAGRDRLELVPEVGGAISRLATVEDGDGTFDWLRPAAAEHVEHGDVGQMSCFPLVPFSNRVGGARFTFEGRTIELKPNFPPEPHAIHGFGWEAVWTVTARDDHSATLEYAHEADVWPFPFQARQHFRLGPGLVEITMDVTNVGAGRMPVGFGWHPFFVRTPGMRLRAHVDGVWLTGADHLPDTHTDVPDSWGLADGLNPSAVALDNNFTGWDGRARIDWPDRGASLEMTTERPISVLVIYTPPATDFACAEPVTNVVDAFNLAASGRDDTGMRMLEPGAQITGTLRLRMERRG